jgi:hypothetical protein
MIQHAVDPSPLVSAAQQQLQQHPRSLDGGGLGTPGSASRCASSCLPLHRSASGASTPSRDGRPGAAPSLSGPSVASLSSISAAHAAASAPSASSLGAPPCSASSLDGSARGSASGGPAGGVVRELEARIQVGSGCRVGSGFRFSAQGQGLVHRGGIQVG